MAGTEYTVEQIKPDEAGVEFFLSRYKPFRLQALQTDPEFFGSNYDREASMEDDFWRKRIQRPEAKIFVAVSAKDGSILSSLTLIRGTSISPLMAMEVGLLPEERDANSATLLHWAVNGVYTAQDARRKGMSRAVFKGAMEFAFETAAAENKSCLVTILARDENEVALGMYQRLGFTALSYVDDQGNVLLYHFRRR